MVLPIEERHDDEPGTKLSRMVQLMQWRSPWEPYAVRWCKGHQLRRAYKLIFNVYDICCGWFNTWLKMCCLGGIYHTALELDGREYCFGGHRDDASGIAALDKPLHVIMLEAKTKLAKAETTDKEREELQQQLRMLPNLRSRVVIGWWLGSKTEFEELLVGLQEEGFVGPSYQLLSKNCNHFAHALCGELEEQTELFQPAPGFKQAADTTASVNTTRITEAAKCCCCPCVKRQLDMRLPPAAYRLHVFEGEGRCIGGTIADEGMAGSDTDIQASPAKANGSLGVAGVSSSTPNVKPSPSLSAPQQSGMMREAPSPRLDLLNERSAV